MATRWVYRAIEESALLGAGGMGDDYPHSRVARRLRYLYRESRDLLYLGISGICAISPVYGNPAIDAQKGAKSIHERMKSIRSLIFYMGARRRGMSTEDELEAQVGLLHALNRNISREAIVREAEAAFGKGALDGPPVLGGSS